MSEWISVEERLPGPEAIRVIVYSPDYYGTEHVGEAVYFSGRFSHGDYHIQIDGVTHWMPLPDPPEAQDEQ